MLCYFHRGIFFTNFLLLQLAHFVRFPPPPEFCLCKSLDTCWSVPTHLDCSRWFGIILGSWYHLTLNLTEGLAKYCETLMPTFMKLKGFCILQISVEGFHTFQTERVLISSPLFSLVTTNFQICKFGPRKLQFFEDFGFWKGGRYFSACDSSPLVLRAHQRQWGIVDAFSQLNPATFLSHKV